MFCRYCGKPIADDSIFCQHCGSNVSIEGFNNRNVKNITDKIGFYYSTFRNNIKWSDIASSLKTTVVFLWKVIKSIFVILAIIIVYTIVGFIMAPAFALFNAEFPSLGMSDMLIDIWKKKKADEITEENESQSN